MVRPHLEYANVNEIYLVATQPGGLTEIVSLAFFATAELFVINMTH